MNDPDYLTGENPCLPARSGVSAVLDAANKATAPLRAVEEIRALVDHRVGDGPRLMVSATAIRNILQRHGL